MHVIWLIVAKGLNESSWKGSRPQRELKNSNLIFIFVNNIGTTKTVVFMFMSAVGYPSIVLALLFVFLTDCSLVNCPFTCVSM